jgi:hypothetical protein
LIGLPPGIVLPTSLLEPRISPLRSSSTSLALTVGGARLPRVVERVDRGRPADVQDAGE